MASNGSQTVIDTVFSHDVFDRLDRDALLARYLLSAMQEDIGAAIRLPGGQTLLTGNIIDSIPPQGIVITQPGTYQFGSDITWSPPAAGACAAIAIQCDGVTLDLGGYQLRAVVQDNSQPVMGISVGKAGATIQGAVIRNGTLVDMCFYGIYASNVAALAIQGITVTGMVYTNLAIRNACPAGIHIDTAEGADIIGCTVQYMYVTSDSSAGIQILNSVIGLVADCQVRHMVNYDGSVQGYSYIGSSGIATAACSADTLRSYFGGNIRTMGHTVLGFCPIFCTELAYEDCSASNITGCCDDAHGMSVFLDAAVSVSNFTATNVVDGAAPYNTGAKATGLEVYGANVTIRNCSVANITAINPQDRQSAGFSAWGSKITFAGCTATDVVVTDQNGRQSPALGHAVGFGWAPDPRTPFCDIGAYNVEYSACTASNCEVGFDTWFHVDSTWQDVSYPGCATGILSEPGGKRTLSGDPASECNPPITITLTNIASGNVYPNS